jgi:hypothetical protein
MIGGLRQLGDADLSAVNSDRAIRPSYSAAVVTADQLLPGAGDRMQDPDNDPSARAAIFRLDPLALLRVVAVLRNEARGPTEAIL